MLDISTFWNLHWAHCCEVRLEPLQKQHFSSAISCYLLAGLLEAHRPFCSKMNFTPRKWPATWRSLSRPVTAWPMHCGIFSFNRLSSLAPLCGCSVLNCCKWPALPGREEAVVWSSNISFDVWHRKLPHYFICIASLVSEGATCGRDGCFLSWESSIATGLRRRTFQKSIFICPFSASPGWTNSVNNKAVECADGLTWHSARGHVSDWWFLSAWFDASSNLAGFFPPPSIKIKTSY